MNSENIASTPSGPRESSDEFSVEISLLGCGHGDTILLRLPGDRWILVDCHLRDHQTRQGFFDFVRSNHIRRLEYIFQTHPDFDHFCGMVHVLDHFTTEGRSIGYWCDGGLNADQVRDLIWGEELSEREYSRLQDRLDELWEKRLIQPVAVNDWTSPVSPHGYSGRVDLFPVAPPATMVREIARGDISKLAKNTRAGLESNALSVVLVLSLVEGSASCNVLLCADASVDEIQYALEAWRRRAKQHGREEGFDVIKVPHHGSIRSHAAELCKSKRGGTPERIAAISAGTRKALPDREVMRAYSDHDWVVLLTTTRTGVQRGNYLMEVADKSGVRAYAVSQQNITITWNSADGLAWEPANARVDAASLDLYETKAGGQ